VKINYAYALNAFHVPFITFYEYLLTIREKKDSFGPFLQIF